MTVKQNGNYIHCELDDNLNISQEYETLVPRKLGNDNPSDGLSEKINLIKFIYKN